MILHIFHGPLSVFSLLLHFASCNLFPSLFLDLLCRNQALSSFDIIWHNWKSVKSFIILAQEKTTTNKKTCTTGLKSDGEIFTALIYQLALDIVLTPQRHS